MCRGCDRTDPATATFADYMQREDRVFREVRDRIERTSAGSAAPPANRYDSRSRSSPSRIGSNGNRTYEIVPAGEIAGGALLIHGLTDSPYSMRAVGETLKASGYYGLALRMPGHGTVPAGLTTAVWEDWLAAVRVGVRHVRERIGPDQPLLLVGYSNGGALVLKYALDEVERGNGPRLTRLVLISPMIGVRALRGWRGSSASSVRSRTSRRPAGSTSCPSTTRSSTTRFPRTPPCSRGGCRRPCRRRSSASARPAA
jgi:alpha-beta hydrolase superfamily lysophospholipase